MAARKGRGQAAAKPCASHSASVIGLINPEAASVMFIPLNDPVKSAAKPTKANSSEWKLAVYSLFEKSSRRRRFHGA